MIDRRMTVGRCLVLRLEQFNVKHVFGVPADYMLQVP
jgi:TPP-dependent 2-oxoacid decarboxylase